jgi:osmotically-inducible protein OsmY
MTDERLTEDVKRELQWDPMVDAAKIAVTVRAGTVMLSGYAQTYREEWAAARAAERVYGVQCVADEIEVRHHGFEGPDDASITEAIQHRFDSSVLIPETVKAEVRDGWVTLRGDAGSPYQQREAEAIIRDVKGVTGVTNQIVVKPEAMASDVAKEVTSALTRNAEFDARSISVTTENGTVCLHGHVHSVHEREAAELAAAAAPGVSVVDNQISVGP